MIDIQHRDWSVTDFYQIHFRNDTSCLLPGSPPQKKNKLIEQEAEKMNSNADFNFRTQMVKPRDFI